MNKEQIKKAALEIQASVVADFEKLLKEYQEASDIDENEPKDLEDLSHQGEATDMLRNLRSQHERAKSKLEVLEAILLNKLDAIGFGALVKTDKALFFISIAAHIFKIGEQNVICISTEAPIYSFMRGKKAGDSFTFAKNTYNILSVA